ncbi:cell cycle control protein 50A-like [Daphnia pulex]|uniref:cell cycle control protein 50A-like n=1 Tax=Daphnia pulex TaxID=6669 RepID=UPI001EE0E8F5|nr:cell cycle control protein 50A-like [Daphnia pulex]
MSCNREKTMLIAHLSNIYQHRRYVKSKDDHQLLEALCPVSNDCEPFAQYPDPNNTRTSITKQVVLCGAIADKPKNWRKHIRDLDPSNPNNNGLQNEDFIGLKANDAKSRFPKLYNRPNRTAEG